MKLQLPSALFSLAFTFFCEIISADFKTMTELLQNSNVSKPTSSKIRPQLRTFNGFEETLLSDYLQYGCWCYMGTGNDGTRRGRSTPVNAFDKVCRQLANGYECAEIDSAQEGEICIASQMNYR